MSEDFSKVNIMVFKKTPCYPCTKVEPILRQILKSSRESATLTLIDIDEEKDLALKYNIDNVPEVYYNNRLVLTGNQAAELISVDAIMGDSESDKLVSSGLGSSSGLFNFLFNELITSSIESNAETLERKKQFNMLTISQKTMTPEALNILSRPSLGDYVHIAVLQSIVTSILAINPQSREYLYKVGRSIGMYGNIQFRFLKQNPRLIKLQLDTNSRFRDLLEGLQEIYSANSLGLPLYLASRSFIEPITDTEAKLTVYDSAYCSQMASIGQPVCYLIAGEISGLITTILGESNVSVIETKCFGLGDPYCQFQIDLKQGRDFSVATLRSFLSKEEKEKFQNSLDSISKNMYSSSLNRLILRPGVSDYVHISVLQQAVNGIKFSDPFFSTLLYYAGLHYGKNGADIVILERVIKEKNYEAPLDFFQSVEAIEGFFNNPSTILSRWNGNVKSSFIDSESAKIIIYESAISSGLDMTKNDFIMDTDGELVTLCDFTTGFIQGRISKILDSNETVLVEETNCQSLGSKYCEFTIELD